MTGSSSSSAAIGCGTPIVRSSRFRRVRVCCTSSRCLRSGAKTEFADARAAWDALPDSLRARIEGRLAIHSIANSRARMGFEMTSRENREHPQVPQVPQVMVRTHRITGRKSVYVASHAGSVVGLPDDDGRALINTLLEHCTQRQFVHRHRWRANDLVVWDNTCLPHRGRPFDDLRWPRDAQRATSVDIGPTWEQEGLELSAEWQPATESAPAQ